MSKDKAKVVNPAPGGVVAVINGKDATMDDIRSMALPPMIVTSHDHYTRGAHEERERTLKHIDVELLSWGLGTRERRALERLRSQIADERLQYRQPNDGGKYQVRVEP